MKPRVRCNHLALWSSILTCRDLAWLASNWFNVGIVGFVFDLGEFNDRCIDLWRRTFHWGYSSWCFIITFLIESDSLGCFTLEEASWFHGKVWLISLLVSRLEALRGDGGGQHDLTGKALRWRIRGFSHVLRLLLGWTLTCAFLSNFLFRKIASALWSSSLLVITGSFLHIIEHCLNTSRCELAPAFCDFLHLPLNIFLRSDCFICSLIDSWFAFILDWTLKESAG